MTALVLRYFAYFHATCYYAPVGFLMLWGQRSEAQIFMAVYAVVTYYFSQKMVRLVLLLAPPAAVLAGTGFSFLASWGARQFLGGDIDYDLSKEAAATGEGDESESEDERPEGLIKDPRQVHGRRPIGIEHFSLGAWAQND